MEDYYGGGTFFIILLLLAQSVPRSKSWQAVIGYEPFESLCSSLNPSEIFIIDLATETSNGSLISHRQLTNGLTDRNDSSWFQSVPMACKWLLRISGDGSSSDHLAVKLNFIFFELPEASDDEDDNELCLANFVKIYRSEDRSRAITGYCGSGWIDPFIGPAGKSLLVEAQMVLPFRGFQIHFSLVSHQRCREDACSDDSVIDFKQSGAVAEEQENDSGCRSPRHMVGSEGSIRSMGYPTRNYDDNAHCYWYITAPPGSQISIAFEPIFSIEQSEGDDDCSFDSLSLFTFDKEGELSLVLRSCGTDPPPDGPIVVPNNKLIAIFDTDSDRNGLGFGFRWATLPDRDGGIGNKPLHPACATKNGLTLEERTGLVSTPTPLPISGADVVCTWTIAPKLPSSQKLIAIYLRFYDFTVARHHDCSISILEIIHNGETKQISCGEKIIDKAITLNTGNPVQIVFRPGSSSVSQHSFEMSYYAATAEVQLLKAVPSVRKIRKNSSSLVKPVIRNCGTSPIRIKIPATQLLIDEKSGDDDDDDKPARVVGGDVSKPGSWPFAVELTFRDKHICGATIINKYWLVTAAHCFQRPSMRRKNGWAVVVGRHTVRSKLAWDKTSPIQYPKIGNIFVHRRFGKIKGSKQFDIALVQLSEPLSLGGIAGAVCLPSRQIRLNDRCFVAGWGDTKKTGENGILRHARLPIIDNSKCKSMQPLYAALVKDSMICAGFKDGRADSCQGDSGGPLVCYINKRWELQGVISFGKGCAYRKAPGVYTRVTTYMPWMKRIIATFSKVIV